MQSGAIIFIVIILACIVITAIYHYQRKQIEKVEEFAVSLGMKIINQNPGKMKLAGEYKGKYVYIQNEIHQQGNHVSYTWWASVESASKLTESEKIEILNQGSNAGFFTRLGRVFTMNRILFNDPEFDAAVVVKTKDEQAARALIDRDVQLRILQYGPGRIVVKDDHIQFEGKGRGQDNAPKVLAALGYICDIEDILMTEKPSYHDSYAPAASTGLISQKEEPRTPVVRSEPKHVSVVKIPERDDGHDVEMSFFEDDMVPFDDEY